jgi:hypothetical protein
MAAPEAQSLKPKARTMRSYRAGESVEDLCRACKIDRVHTVIVVDGAGRPLRVQCDYCGSQHNFRGTAFSASARPAADLPKPAGEGGLPVGQGTGVQPAGAPVLSERERLSPPVSVGASDADLEALLRKVIRAESGVTVAVPADKWRDGLMVLRPGKPGVQEKSWPVETFFHKVVMIRNRLRTLEQQVNAMDIPEDAKVRLQAYITACYGSLTSFNVLFADEDDHFKGSGE